MRNFTAAGLGLALILTGCTANDAPPTASSAPPSSTAAASPDAETVASLELYNAATSSDIERAKKALAAGADPNHDFTEFEASPFDVAISDNDLEMVQLMLDAGAEVELTFPDGQYSELDNAGANAGADVMRALLATGANPEGVGPVFGGPLEEAANNNNLPALLVLLDAGADPAFVRTDTDNSWTALITAGAGGAMDTAIALVEAGADPSYVGTDGRTAADWADHEGHPAVAEYLRSVGG